MSKIAVPQAKYALLNEDIRTRNVSNKKLCLMSTAVLLSFAFAGVIILIVNLEYFMNGFKLPSFYQPQEFPNQWLQRAIKYNTLNEDKMSKSIKEHSNKSYRYKNLPDYKLVCYYSIPTPNSAGKILQSNNLDPNLCTHINVGFITLDNNTLLITPIINETLRNISALKLINKNLKVLISVGGAGDDTGFPQMVLNHENRKSFIGSVLTTIKEFKLDGVDLDWEFPNEQQHGDKKQRMHFTQLLHEIRKEISRHSEKHQFLLSVAVAAPETIIDNSYDITYMNEYVDYINVMSYDFHFYTKLTPFTGINAPLYPHSKEKGYLKTLNINASVFYWHENGMDKSKIVVGLPTYGHSFQLLNVDNNGLTAPAIGYGKIGNLGFVDYADVCWFLSYYKIRPVFDMEAKSPYAFKGNEWISYENLESLTYKTDYIKANNFGGAMILSLNTDDHTGKCDNSHKTKATENFPLTRKVKSILYDDQL